MRVEDPGGLVRAAAAGEVAAWDRLVDGFAGMVWSVARSVGLDHADAADVSQTTWLRLAEHLHRLQDPDRVGGWLATTARREAVRIAQRADRVRPVPSGLDGVDERVEDAEAQLISAESDTALWLAFESLGGPCRSLLRALIADPPLSYGDISELLDMPVGSIGPRRARCLQTLRRLVLQMETDVEEAVGMEPAGEVRP